MVDRSQDRIWPQQDVGHRSKGMLPCHDPDPESQDVTHTSVRPSPTIQEEGKAADRRSTLHGWLSSQLDPCRSGSRNYGPCVTAILMVTTPVSSSLVLSLMVMAR